MAELCEHRPQALCVRSRELPKDVSVQRIHGVVERRLERLPCHGQENAVDAAVGGIGASLNEACVDEPVKHAGAGRTIELQPLA